MVKKGVTSSNGDQTDSELKLNTEILKLKLDLKELNEDYQGVLVKMQEGNKTINQLKQEHQVQMQDIRQEHKEVLATYRKQNAEIREKYEEEQKLLITVITDFGYDVFQDFNRKQLDETQDTN